MKGLLIVTHAFNMDGRAASQTITDKIPYFLESGYRLFVLSAVTGEKDTRFFHQQLLPLGPNGLRFDLRHWLRRKIGKGVVYRGLMFIVSLVLFPLLLLERIIFGLQSQSSWAVSAYLYAKQLIQKERISVVYTTGGAYSAHLAGWWLKKTLGIKWIVEVHDPLVATGQPIIGRDKKFQANLEKIICDNADHVWWFTKGALASAQKRHPSLGHRGFYVLPGAMAPKVRGVYQQRERLHFVHLGSLSATRKLLPFVKALHECVIKNPEWRSRLIVDVYGGSLDGESKAFIHEHGIEEMICVYGRLEYDAKTGLSGRDRVVQKMFEADCLLLLHGEDHVFCAEYIPSKLYEYFWANRPILGLIDNNQQLQELIIERGGFIADTASTISIVEAIVRVYKDWHSGRLTQEVDGRPLTVEQAVLTVVQQCQLF